jgi:hypothetical protein
MSLRRMIRRVVSRSFDGTEGEVEGGRERRTERASRWWKEKMWRRAAVSWGVMAEGAMEGTRVMGWSVGRARGYLDEDERG